MSASVSIPPKPFECTDHSASRRYRMGGRASDVGGPEVRTAAEFARAYFEAAGRSRRVVEVPVPGKMARAWREGAHLSPDQRYGRITWEEFLGRTLRSSNTDGTTRKELA